MGKQSQLLPRMPHIGSTDLFNKDCVAVHYEEYNNTSKSYRPIVAEFDDLESAQTAVEFLQCVRILEPLIRFLTGQIRSCVEDPRSNSRLQPVKMCKSNFEVLIKPGNQTTSRIVRHFANGGEQLFKNCLPGKKSKYYDRGQALLAEIQAFILQYSPAKTEAA